MSVLVKKPIAWQLARTVIIITFVLGSLLSVAQIYIDYREAGGGFDKKIKESQRVAEKAATRAVFLLDNDLAQEVALGFMEYDYVIAAEIFDDRGLLLARQTRSAIGSEAPDQKKQDAIDADIAQSKTNIVQANGQKILDWRQAVASWLAQLLFENTRHYSYDLILPPEMSKTPGRLQLLVKPSVGLQPFIDRAITVFLSGMLRNLLMAFLLYLVFYIGLAKPLRALVEQISQIDPEHPGEQRLFLTKSHQEDEIALLTRQINQSFDAVQLLLNNLRATNRALSSSEESLRLRSWELEQEVERARRTSIELMATKEQAEAASRAKTAFLANVSHELRTPLNAIIGFSSVMTEELFGPIGHEKYRQYLHDIRSSSQHLSELLGEVLDLAKIEAGELTIDDETIDLKRLAEESLALTGPQAQAKNIAITLDIEAGLPNLRGDRLRLKQAVLNLLSNAVKFTPKGREGVTLKFFLDDEGQMAISVSDHGIGIAREEQGLIFSPFIRSSSALSRSHEGSGLGLSLVKAFVEGHQGWITLESKPGQGARFTLYFPKDRLVFVNKEKQTKSLSA